MKVFKGLTKNNNDIYSETNCFRGMYMELNYLYGLPLSEALGCKFGEEEKFTEEEFKEVILKVSKEEGLVFEIKEGLPNLRGIKDSKTTEGMLIENILIEDEYDLEDLLPKSISVLYLGKELDYPFVVQLEGDNLRSLDVRGKTNKELEVFLEGKCEKEVE